MANVSITTASMVLNGKARQNHISLKTEQRILGIIEKNHYTPNAAAQAIVGGRTNLIGFIMRDEIDKSFWAEILAGVSAVLEKADYHLILSFALKNLGKEFHAMDFLRSKRVDAYILVPDLELISSTTKLKKLQEYNQECPLVLLTTQVEGLNSIAVDEKKGGALAARHLLSLGHRKLATIGAISQINSRLMYFEETAVKYGATVKHFPDIEAFLPHAKEVTGAFCFSDNIAVQLLNQCNLNGIRIPDDLSVVGYDNQPISELSLPKLTTIHQPKRSFGEKIGQFILKQLNGPKSPVPEQILLQPKLIVRDSTSSVTP